MVKKKRNNLLIGIFIIILAIVSIFSIYYFTKDSNVDGQTFSITPFDEKPLGDMVLLDFCASEESCISYLSQEGMPPNFLQERGYVIYCQNANCYFKKI